MELLIYPIIMVAMFVLLILPQRRQQKAHAAMLGALEVGDEVLTTAGIYGTVTEFDGPTVFLAINDDNEIKITKSSVAERIVYGDE